MRVRPDPYQMPDDTDEARPAWRGMIVKGVRAGDILAAVLWVAFLLWLVL
jgi:hypothetical protein